MKWHHLAASKGSPARYAIIGAALLLWLTLLALVLLQQDISCPGQPQPVPFMPAGPNRPHPHFVGSCQQLRRDLDRLRTELHALEEENRQLKELAANRDFRPVEADKFLLKKEPQDGSKIEADGADLRRIEPLVVAEERRMDGQLYSREHEETRRTLANAIWELYLRFNGQEMQKKLSQKEQQSWERQFTHLLALSSKMSMADRADEWHKRALGKVAERISETLERLQNPTGDCANARLMICELNKGCGFGCQLHHLSYCLIMSAAANRTLVLEKDGQEWRYSERGWTAVFQPISKCTWAKEVSTSPGSVDHFTDLHQSTRIVRLPIVDGLAARPPHLPLSFPSQFAHLLLTHHSNPPVFFIGQFLNFLMRSNEQTSKFVLEAEKKIPFELGPVVGLQIRRTDKVGTEAAFHGLEEYMEWAELWFAVEQSRLGITLAKRAFIATDDRTVIDEAREKYGPKGWTVFGNDETAEAARPGTRYSDRSLLGVIADVRLLSKCSYLVCTFSSQVCRMGYEMMQVEQGDAGERAHSLDDIFYFGGQHAHELEAIDGFKADGPDQIDLLKGDIIGIAGNHWNGWSKGLNRRTGQSGLFPSYLAREKWRTVDFSVFDN